MNKSAYQRRDQHPQRPVPILATKALPAWRRWLRDWLLGIVARLQGRPVWPYPLEAFCSVQDRAGHVYVWQLSPDCTPDEETAIAAHFEHEFVGRYNREPRAIHIFTSDIRQVQRLSAEDVETHIAPYLRGEDA